MPFNANASKHLSSRLSPNPCKFFCHFNLIPRCFSSLPKPSEPEHEPEKDQTLIQDSPKSDCYGTRREQPPIADKLFKLAPKSGSYKQGDSTFYSLIENYANSGDLRSLEKVFDRMKREKRVFVEKSFILVFRAYGKARLPDKAVELFERMVDEFQCRRTVRSFNSVLNVIIQSGCVPNEVTYNTLIHGLCLKGKLDKAISLLHRMVSNKHVPNDITYGTIINGLVKQGRAVDGACIFRAMEERGHRANEYVYSSLISGLFKEGKSEEALKLWNEMIEKGSKPNTIVYSALIDGLCREDQGCDPDSVTCNIFLTILSEKLSPPQSGGEFLDELVLRLHKRQRILGASNIIEVMLRKALYPKLSTLEKIVRELCKPKKVQVAINKCWNDLFL
nr:pentatricopeptide repeat-containing protein At4g20090 [Ipomoea trifida]